MGDKSRCVFRIKVQVKFDAAMDSVPPAWELIVVADLPDALEPGVLGPTMRRILSLFMVVVFSFCTLLVNLLAKAASAPLTRRSLLLHY